MPRERQRQNQKTHKAVEIDSEAQKTMKILRVQHVDKIVNFPVVSQHQSTNRPDDSHRWNFLRVSRLFDEGRARNEAETVVDQLGKSRRPLRRHMGRVPRDTSRSPG